VVETRLRSHRGRQAGSGCWARPAWIRSGLACARYAKRSASRRCCTWARAWITPRILTVLTQVAEEGGLGEDISQIPAVGLAPEWMRRKAARHWGLLWWASGVYVIFGGASPVGGMPDRVQGSDSQVLRLP